MRYKPDFDRRFLMDSLRQILVTKIQLTWPHNVIVCLYYRILTRIMVIIIFYTVPTDGRSVLLLSCDFFFLPAVFASDEHAQSLKTHSIGIPIEMFFFWN